MRHFFVIGMLMLLGLSTGRSQSLNIATWIVELPETNSTNRATEYEPVLKRAAGVLKPLNADVILLHGLPDRAAARQLVDLLRPRVYHNPVFSAFRQSQQNQTIVDPPITILSRKQPVGSRSVEWKATGQIDSPGGFSVAIFKQGTNSFFLYTAQFPRVRPGMTPQQEAAIPHKRELCARYLISHLNWLTETSTNAAKVTYLATDLELESAGGLSASNAAPALDSLSGTNDPAMAILTEAGFKACSGSRTLVASTALSNTGWPPEGALTSAFIRGTEFPGDPESISRKSFFAPVALVEVDVSKPPPGVISTTVLVKAPVVMAAATGAVIGADGLDPLSSWVDSRTLMVGGAGVIILVGVFGLVLRTRAHSRLAAGGAVSVAGLSEGEMDLSRGLLSGSRPVLGVLENPQTNDDSSAHANNSGQNSESASKGSSWPFLHLLRERLVRWLAADRSQLLSSHHAGTEQVLELEERLTKIQNQLESRLRAREQRVGELEAELMAKEKQILDLELRLATRDARKSSLS